MPNEIKSHLKRRLQSLNRDVRLLDSSEVSVVRDGDEMGEDRVGEYFALLEFKYYIFRLMN